MEKKVENVLHLCGSNILSGQSSSKRKNEGGSDIVEEVWRAPGVDTLMWTDSM